MASSSDLVAPFRPEDARVVRLRDDAIAYVRHLADGTARRPGGHCVALAGS